VKASAFVGFPSIINPLFVDHFSHGLAESQKIIGKHLRQLTNGLTQDFNRLVDGFKMGPQEQHGPTGAVSGNNSQNWQHQMPKQNYSTNFKDYAVKEL
jgi:hypothetical protein